MALPPEANSLSSITQLAGNPPRYPRNPTEKRRESLVLYIARVPGGKDIILTTMKPRLKNVTAEDVINSLYYLHLDTPDDLLLLEQTKDARDTEFVPEPYKQPISRKPVSPSPTMEALQESPPVESVSVKVQSDVGTNISTARQGQEEARPPMPKRPPPEVNAIPVRRPLGPRPFISQPQQPRRPLLGEENVPIGANPSTEFLISRTLKPETYSSDDSSARGQRLGAHERLTPFSGTSVCHGPFLITLIRRDPTSGAQWNIGKIRADPLPDIQSPHNQRKASLGRQSSLLVHLTTLGYGQFQAPQKPCPTIATNIEAINSQQISGIETGFDRQVHMDWSSSWSRKFKQHRRGSSDQSEIRESARERSNTDIAPALPERGTGSRDREDLNSQLIVPKCGFLSPWNGRCEFSTGTSGRTLKCKHILPRPSMASSAITALSESAPVSELRFNLPSVTTPNGPSGASQESERFKTSKLPVLRKKLSSDSQKQPASPNLDPTSYAALYPSDGEAESGHLDLSLGREKAGGGIRGKRAKLGKLIVHDEGLKMLDLVVGANMSIWWSIWDR